MRLRTGQSRMVFPQTPQTLNAWLPESRHAEEDESLQGLVSRQLRPRYLFYLMYVRLPQSRLIGFTVARGATGDTGGVEG